ncbi:hypothetical protein ILUMI_21543 [Ignelater luminosus]|uniref:Uncharacterized protein n=1 Tax=Ignelater luminosus TaxID=2038154 RepID=A0A8K0CIQ8_IGNLU|nr:hypothetical protein ILUMI_21543 [Ignelater luminosus]
MIISSINCSILFFRNPVYNKRVACCTWFQDSFDDNTLDLMFFSGESWFYLSRDVSSQIMRMWSTDSPNFIRERRIINPIFFEDFIDAERYQNNILQSFIDRTAAWSLSAGQCPTTRSLNHLGILETIL